MLFIGINMVIYTDMVKTYAIYIYIYIYMVYRYIYLYFYICVYLYMHHIRTRLSIYMQYVCKYAIYMYNIQMSNEVSPLDRHGIERVFIRCMIKFEKKYACVSVCMQYIYIYIYIYIQHSGEGINRCY